MNLFHIKTDTEKSTRRTGPGGKNIRKGDFGSQTGTALPTGHSSGVISIFDSSSFGL